MLLVLLFDIGVVNGVVVGVVGVDTDDGVGVVGVEFVVVRGGGGVDGHGDVVGVVCGVVGLVVNVVGVVAGGLVGGATVDVVVCVFCI